MNRRAVHHMPGRRASGRTSSRAAVGSPSPAAAQPSRVGASDSGVGPRANQALPSSGAPATRHAREPIEMSAETRELLQRGKLEQTCPDCGRWEAASWYCSWCARAMAPADWYRNGDKVQRAARMPKVAPAVAPSEYRHSLLNWPKAWGKYPGEIRTLTSQEAPRAVQTLGNGFPDANRVLTAIPPSSSAVSAAKSPLPALSGAEHPAAVSVSHGQNDGVVQVARPQPVTA